MLRRFFLFIAKPLDVGREFGDSNAAATAELDAAELSREEQCLDRPARNAQPLGGFSNID